MDEEFASEYLKLAEVATDNEVLEAIFIVAHRDEAGEYYLSAGGTKEAPDGARKEMLLKAMELLS